MYPFLDSPSCVSLDRRRRKKESTIELNDTSARLRREKVGEKILIAKQHLLEMEWIVTIFGVSYS